MDDRKVLKALLKRDSSSFATYRLELQYDAQVNGMDGCSGFHESDKFSFPKVPFLISCIRHQMIILDTLVEVDRQLYLSSNLGFFVLELEFHNVLSELKSS